ncbi:hypothetical protein OURE66S_01522 [Oligella ureolytica]
MQAWCVLKIVLTPTQFDRLAQAGAIAAFKAEDYFPGNP